MREHGSSKHGLALGTPEMDAFNAKCVRLAQRGTRFTSKEKILSLLGRYADSKSHYTIAERVLEGHLIVTTESPPRASSSRESECTSAFEPLSSESEESISTGDSHVSVTYSSSADRGQHRPSASFRQTKMHIEQSGFASTVSEREFGAMVRRYHCVEMRSGKKARSTVLGYCKLLHRYIQWCKIHTPLRDDKGIILCKESPYRFMTRAASTFQSNTMKNHATALLSFIDLALFDKSLWETSIHDRRALNEVRDIWKSIKQRFDKMSRQEQRTKVRAGQFRNAHVYMILEYLCDNSTRVERIMERAKVSVNRVSSSDLKLLQCTVAVILALNGQRLVSAISLKVSEVREAKRREGLYIIRVASHKTSRQHGPASFALTPLQYDIVFGLADYVGKMRGPEAKVLDAPQGSACKALFSSLNEYVIKKGENWDAFTFNVLRKTIESNVHLTSGSTTETRDRVNSYLCHGRSATELYYRYKSDAVVAADSRLLQSILAQLIVLDLARENKLELPKTWEGGAYYV